MSIEHENELKTLKIGDKVIISENYGRHSIGRLKEVTKGGNYKVEYFTDYPKTEKVFNNTRIFHKDGFIRGTNKWDNFLMYKFTDERYNKWVEVPKKCNILEKVNWKKLSEFPEGEKFIEGIYEKAKQFQLKNNPRKEEQNEI